MVSSKIQPAVVWFTGLSGSGKSTLAEKVEHALKMRGVDTEILDGDRVRAVFPSIGFSLEERNAHIRRMGFMAGLLEKHGVVVLASFVSPYAEARQAARWQCRNFIEVYLSTPLAECERRDVKGLYGKARRGEISNFTGVSDPYEVPENPDLVIDTTAMSVEESVALVLGRLQS
ncbi:MAG: adenylyl-sulfate kinase [bacterium]